MTTNASTRRRWLPRFGLRTLLVAVTAIGVLCGAGMFWYRAVEAEYQRQSRLGEQLSEFGEIEWEQQTPPWLRWAGDWKVFQRITSIDCHGSAEGHQLLDVAQQVPTLVEIRLYDGALSENVVQRLANLRQLKHLVVKTAEMAFGGLSAEVLQGAQAKTRAAEEMTENLQKKYPSLKINHSTILLF